MRSSGGYRDTIGIENDQDKAQTVLVKFLIGEISNADTI